MKLKKIVSLLLSLVMLLSLLVTTAVAAEAHITIDASKNSAAAGETFTITVSNKAMIVSSFTGGIAFDTSKLECVSIKGALEDNGFYLVKASGGLAPYVPATAVSTVTQANTYGTVGFAWTGTVDTAYAASAIATVTFRVKDGATSTGINVYERSASDTNGPVNIPEQTPGATGNETITIAPPAVPTYTVTYKADGNTVYTETVEHGKDVANVPAVPVKTGYTGAWDNDGKNITADRTINAVYTAKTYTVTYKADGQVVGTPQTVEHGKNAVAPAVPAKTGYTGVWDHDGKNITADTTINAVYTINKYTVTFNANNGSGTMAPVTNIAHGTVYTLPANGFTPPAGSGAAFVGWALSPNGSAITGTTITVTDNTTLYAVWQGGTGGPIDVTGVSLNKNTMTLTVGGSETLTATVAPSNATNKAVTWSSSNPAVATVVNGKVTAVSDGNATITVTTADGGKTATCVVTVTAGGTPTPTPPSGGAHYSHFDNNSDGKCDYCGVKINCKHTDANKDGFCDSCGYKTVKSSETFDAGIALYAGMAVLAATGSAVVIGKKKKD